ncbi:hypothetical protein FAI40_01620 [Acetobacteraceae bacterium]|nr:hypothetical protein FAI40_01620 [Acetobacteraceae bacterium]
MKKIIFLLVASFSFSLSHNAWAEICNGVAVKDFKDESGSLVKKGTLIEQLHMGDFNSKGDPVTYEVHGGYVWPAKMIKLKNCHIVKTQKNGSISSDIILDDTPENQYQIKFQRTEKFLSDNANLTGILGQGITEEALAKPDSKLGKAVTSFIENRKKDKNFPAPDVKYWEALIND